MKNKVLLINNCHYRRGGADVVYLNTGNLLKKNGHEVFYFSLIDEKNIKSFFDSYFVKKINFLKLSIIKKLINFHSFFYYFKSRNKLKSLIKDFRPDVAHVHFYKGGLTSSIFKVLKDENIPIVFTAHDFGLVDPHNVLLDGNFKIYEKTITHGPFYCVIGKSNRNSFFLSLISYLEYKFHNLIFPFDQIFNQIIVVSKFSQNKLGESKFFNFNTIKLYNFFPEIKQVSPSVIKGEYFLFFGRLSKEKGFETLFNLWSKMNFNIKLKVAGTFDASIHNENSVDISKIDSKLIEFVGFKEGKDLEKLIKNSSFVIVPSECYENNPLSIIESYALGKPVIGSDIGGVSEIILHDKTGYLFKMGDQASLRKYILKSVNISNDDYFRMSFNAREFALKNFNPKNHYESLTKIYNKTIKDYEKK